MDKIKLSKEKLLEILKKSDDADTMEFYYNAALADKIEATEYGALLALLLMLVRYYNKKIFVDKHPEPLAFFGLNSFSEDSEYWKYKELLNKTSFIVLMCKIHNEKIPDKPLEEFAEMYSQALFSFGNYLAFLSISQNALRINKNNALCNFLKACIVELCYINKTPPQYKIALINYQKSLLEKCKPDELPLETHIYETAVNKVNSMISPGEFDTSKLRLTPVLESFEKTVAVIPEWTEEHDFYLRNNLFLNPLSNFDHFVECAWEDLEELPVREKIKNLFNEIVSDYKLCRGLTFSYYKSQNGVKKREMCMVYSYAYSLFDKLAYLLKIAFNLKMDEQQIGFTKEHLFEADIVGTTLKFKDIKNNNIIPLFLIAKKARSKQKITNALQTGTFEHNELRNTINHKSILYVKDSKLQRNSSMLLELARDAILYTYMLLHSCSKNDYNNATAIKTTYLAILADINKE